MAIDIATLPGAEEVNLIKGEVAAVPVWALVHRHFTKYEKQSRSRMLEYEATITIARADVAEVDPVDDELTFDDRVWAIDSFQLSSFRDFWLLEVTNRESVDERIE
jgi:hypothetical protein